MTKLTAKQAQAINKKIANIYNNIEGIKTILLKHNIIDEDGNASEELSEDARDAVSMVCNAGEFDFLYERLDEITK